LTTLQEHHYDVALLDFRLPHMDGVRVASSIRKVADGRTLPRLIAMTADIEGLLAHAEDCENFDHVLSKPLDISQVGKLVEEQAEIGALPPLPAPAAPRRTTADLKPAPAKHHFSTVSTTSSFHGRAIWGPRGSRQEACKRPWATRGSTPS
jgi:CheY-like chemotaxis protein